MQYALETPEGIYVPLEALLVPMPSSIQTDLASGAVNPLAADLAQPMAATRGCRFAEIPSSSLQSPQSSGNGRHKPKLSLLRNKASVISMAVVYEGYAKRLLEGQSSSLAWVNIGRILALMDLDINAPNRNQQLAKIMFTQAWPIVADVNRFSASPTQLDLAVGLSNGEVLWIESVSNRFSRMNKDGTLASNAPATAIAWVPQSSTIVAVGYGNGSVGIYDVEREDGAPLSTRNTAHHVNLSTPSLKVIQSGTTPHKSNPIAFYNVSNDQITALKFNGGGILAVSSRDGYVRIIDMAEQRVSDILPSYFGAVTCMEISPDSKYLVIGGEDDCLGIYNLETMDIVARLEGHRAFVLAVAFDIFQTEAATYRIGSVGEDGRIILWDFSPDTLPHRLSGELKRPTMLGDSQVHPFVPHSDVPVIFPVAQSAPEIEGLEPASFCDILFDKGAISATTSDGVIFSWQRPQD